MSTTLQRNYAILLALAMLVDVTQIEAIGLHHPLDGITNTEYKLMCYTTI
jgi:hypothetical protein